MTATKTGDAPLDGAADEADGAASAQRRGPSVADVTPARTARIALMAKAPVAGLAKTRLIPALGAANAAALAEQMLLHATRVAAEASAGPVTLWTAPDDRHAAFQRLQQTCGAVLRLQPEGDLGARMSHVFSSAFAAARTPVLLMGTDAPGLTPAHLHQAASALQQHDVVFVPAFDGGYVLVGLRACPPGLLAALFDGMTWSTPQVLAQTRTRLAVYGVQHVELDPVHDIDDAADLAHVPQTWLADLGARIGGGRNPGDVRWFERR